MSSWGQKCHPMQQNLIQAGHVYHGIVNNARLTIWNAHITLGIHHKIQCHSNLEGRRLYRNNLIKIVSCISYFSKQWFTCIFTFDDHLHYSHHSNLVVSPKHLSLHCIQSIDPTVVYFRNCIHPESRVFFHLEKALPEETLWIQNYWKIAMLQIPIYWPSFEMVRRCCYWHQVQSMYHCL